MASKMSAGVQISKGLKNMEFMKRGAQRKREQEEEEKAAGEREIVDMDRYLHTQQNEDDGFLTTDSQLLCMDLQFGRFSYQKVNPEIEKLMALNDKKNNTEEREAEDEIDVSKEEMARVLGNKRRRHR